MSDNESPPSSHELPREKILDFVKRDVHEVLNDPLLTPEHRYTKAGQIMDEAQEKGATFDELADLTGVTEHPKNKAHHLRSLREATRDLLEISHELDESEQTKQKTEKGRKIRDTIDLILTQGVTLEEIRDTYYPEAIEYNVRAIANKLLKKQKITKDEDDAVRQMINNAKDRGLSAEIVQDIFNRVARETGVNQKSLLSQQVDKAKEGLRQVTKSKLLRFKEFFGVVDRNDFAQIMEADFQEEARKNPPIDKIDTTLWDMPDQEFSREAARKNPAFHRPSAQESYKDLTDRQDRAIAACRTAICRQIEFDDETPKTTIMKTVERYAQNYAFSRYQRWQTENLVDTLQQNTQLAQELSDQYESDADLFHELTGEYMSPTQNIDIVVGPYGFEVTTDKDTLTTIQDAHRGTKPFIEGSYVLKTKHTPPIQVIMLDSQGDIESDKAKVRQHVKAKLFGRALVADLKQEQAVTQTPTRNLDELDDNEWQLVVEQDMNDRQTTALEKAKNEILALRASLDLYPNFDVFFKNDLGPHDYLGKLRSWANTESAEIQQAARKIFVEQYQQIIQTGVGALNRLIKEGDYSKDEAIASLVNIPIDQWHQTVEQVMEAKKARKANSNNK